MKKVQVIPRFTVNRPASIAFKFQKLCQSSSKSPISFQPSALKPLSCFSNVITRSLTSSMQTNSSKPINVNTNPLDINSNLNILQGLILAGEYANTDNRIQKILKKNNVNKIGIELWNLMLSFYASQREDAKLESTYKVFKESNAHPNTGTFVLLLQYYGSLGKNEEIEKLLSQAQSSTQKLDFPLIVHTAIASSSDFKKMYVFAEMLKAKQNSDTLMAIIVAAIKNNNISEMELAIKRFRERGIEPHADAYIAILSAHYGKNNEAKVNQYLLEIKKKQLDKNPQVVKLLQNLKLRIPEPDEDDES